MTQPTLFKPSRSDTTQPQEVPPLKGLNKYIPMINPGLAPWAMQEYRPLGAHCRQLKMVPSIREAHYKNVGALELEWG